MIWIQFLGSKIAALILAWVVSLPAPQVYVAPTPTATVISQTQQNYNDIDKWLAQSNWPKQYWETVKRIVWCESRGIVGIATSPPHVGLMQVNVNYWGRVNADAVSELNQGYEVFKIQGFNAWSCY